MKKIVLILAAAVFVGLIQETEARPRRPRPHIATVRLGVPHRHIGMRFSKHLRHYVVIRFKNIPYYYADGIYYRKINKEYKVILPEIGMQVPELPEQGVKTIETDNGIRFVYDGVIYKAVPMKKGVKYEVVGFMKQEP